MHFCACSLVLLWYRCLGLHLLEDATGVKKKVAVAVAAVSSPLPFATVPLSVPATDPSSASTIATTFEVACVEKKLPEQVLPSVGEKLRVLDASLVALERPGRWKPEWAEDEDIWLPQSLIVSCVGTSKNCGVDLEQFDPESPPFFESCKMFFVSQK